MWCYSLLLPSLEVPVSKLDPNTNYLELKSLRGFPQSPQDVISKTMSYRFQLIIHLSAAAAGHICTIVQSCVKQYTTINS